MFLSRKAWLRFSLSMIHASNAFELWGQAVREANIPDAFFVQPEGLQYIDPVREAIITVPEGTTSAFVDDKAAKIITREQILETIKKSFNIEGEKTPWGT